MFTIIEIIVGLIALGILYFLFFNYVYPFFTKNLKPGWLTEKHKEENAKAKAAKEAETEQPTENSENQ